MKRTKKIMLKLAGMVMFLMLCMGAGRMVYAQTAITPPMLKAGSTKGAKSYQFELTGDERIRVPVSVSKAGKVCFEATANAGVIVAFSDKPDLKSQEDFISVGQVSSEKEIIDGYAAKAGTYYMYALIGDGAEKATLKIKAYATTAAVGNAGTLSNGKWVTTSGISSIFGGKPAYFKIKAPSSGCVKLEIKKLGGLSEYIDTAFTNSKKKIMIDQMDPGVYYYGVNKGTYYVKVDTDNAYKIRYTFENIKDKKNITKKKAVSLKQKKTEKGFFFCKDKKSRWYKLTLKKTQTVKLTVSANTDEYGFSYEITDSKGNGIDYNNLTGSGKKQFKKKLKAGTYYLEISPPDSSGSFSIKWN